MSLLLFILILINNHICSYSVAFSSITEKGPFELYIFYNESNIGYWSHVDHLSEYADIIKQAVFDTLKNLTDHDFDYDNPNYQDSWEEMPWSIGGISEWRTCMLLGIGNYDNCPSNSQQAPSTKYANYAAVVQYLIVSDGNTVAFQNYVLWYLSNENIAGGAVEQSIFSVLLGRSITRLTQAQSELSNLFQKPQIHVTLNVSNTTTSDDPMTTNQSIAQFEIVYHKRTYDMTIYILVGGLVFVTIVVCCVLYQINKRCRGPSNSKQTKYAEVKTVDNMKINNFKQLVSERREEAQAILDQLENVEETNTTETTGLDFTDDFSHVDSNVQPM